MNNSKRRPGRATTRLTRKIERDLLGYASAAMAGAGLLASTQTAEAKIVYTQTRQVIASNTSLKLDLDGDGIADFTIDNIRFGSARASHDTGGRTSRGYLRIIGQQGQNLAIGHKSVGLNLANALAAKTKIGPSAGFLTNASASMEFCFKTPENSSVLHGSWLGVTNRYVGLKFQISGQTHYGWARFSGVRQGPDLCSLTGVLTGYAYETVANRPIVAGKTSGPQAAIGETADSTQHASLAVLALGAPALIVWRKEEKHRRSDNGGL